jgi:hypothetical protein
MKIMKHKIKLLGLLFALASSARAAEVTNTASITTNLFFYFTAGTNYLDHSKFPSSDMIRYTIASRDKKPELFRIFTTRQAFGLKLSDASGRPVPRTKFGLLWGQPVDPPKSTREATRLYPRPAGETYFLFRPDDLFVITNRGTYDLEVRLTLWARTTNSVPDIEIWSIENPKANLHYGVVVSEPLRVKVIKQ